MADLEGSPERGSRGEVVLRFKGQGSCDIEFEDSTQGDDFVEQARQAAGLDSTPPSKSKTAATSRLLGAGGAASSQKRPFRAEGIAVADDAGGLSRVCVEAVRAAATRGRSQPFVSPMSGLFPSGWAGESQALCLVAELCAAWEEAAKRQQEVPRAAQATEAVDEQGRLQEMLRDADLKLLEVKSKLEGLCKANGFLERENEILRKEASDPARAKTPEALREHNRLLERELNACRQRLREQYDAGGASASGKRAKPADDVNQRLAKEVEELRRQVREGAQRPNVARAIAEMEGGPLKIIPADERHNLKRKLLLKWHPDKQPSAEHTVLAKKVMQELQNLREWA